MIRALLFCLAMLLWALPSAAVEPGEMLDDPALEARAREISATLRCLVCRNESIDESNADLARDLRILLRERLSAGDTDDEAVNYIVARYGDFVLLKPRFRGGNILLWLSGPAALLIGLVVTVVFIRRRNSAAPQQAGLSAEEQSRLDRLLGE